MRRLVYTRTRPGSKCCGAAAGFAIAFLYAGYPVFAVGIGAQSGYSLLEGAVDSGSGFYDGDGWLRKVINARRPYEVWRSEPLVHKEKKGGSPFPGRHVASAVILAVAFWYICPPAGIAAGSLMPYTSCSCTAPHCRGCISRRMSLRRQ